MPRKWTVESPLRNSYLSLWLSGNTIGARKQKKEERMPRNSLFILWMLTEWSSSVFWLLPYIDEPRTYQNVEKGSLTPRSPEHHQRPSLGFVNSRIPEVPYIVHISTPDIKLIFPFTPLNSALQPPRPPRNKKLQLFHKDHLRKTKTLLKSLYSPYIYIHQKAVKVPRLA